MSKRKRPTGPKSKDSGQDRKAGGSAKTEGWLYGTHAVLAALANEERRCKRLVLTEEAAHDRLVDLALLGTHVERWDKLPRGDRAVALGRAEDGFWSGGRFDRSRAVGWMQLEAERPATRLWYRSPEDPKTELRRTIETALGIEIG